MKPIGTPPGRPYVAGTLVEAVEPRRLLSSVMASLVDGTLAITGTSDANVVELAVDAEDNLTVASGEASWSFPRSEVAEIELHLLAGDDALTIRQGVGRPTSYAGGEGRDAIRVEGSEAGEFARLTSTVVFIGGYQIRITDVEDSVIDLLGGDDSIDARMGTLFAGTTLILGGEGNDLFTALSGSQGITLDGGAGDDTFKKQFGGYASAIGGPGHDEVHLLGTVGNDNALARSQFQGWRFGLVHTDGSFGGFDADLSVESARFDLGGGNDVLEFLFDAFVVNRNLSLTLKAGDGADSLNWRPLPASNYGVTTRLIAGEVSTGNLRGTFDTAVESVALTGTGLPDRFEIAPIAQAVTVAAYSPNPASGHTTVDTLALDLTEVTGVGIEIGAPGEGTLHANNSGGIQWTGIEVLEGLPAPNLIGGAFDFEQGQAVELVLSDTVPDSISLADAVLTHLRSGVMTEAFSAIELAGGADGPTTVRFVRDIAGTGPLPDGNYRLTLPARVLDGPLGTTNDAITFDFYVLAGDANRDRTVNFTDFLVLRGNFGRSDDPLFSQADFNYDGRVDFADFLLVRGNFGTTLAPPAAPSLFNGGEDESLGGNRTGSLVQGVVG